MNWAIQANRLTSETVESVEIRINLGRFCIKFKLNQFLISNLFQVNFNATVHITYIIYYRYTKLYTLFTVDIIYYRHYLLIKRICYLHYILHKL